MSESGVFRPEGVIVALNVFAAVCLAALTIAVGIVLSQDGGSMFLALAGAGVLVGGWLVYRSTVMRVGFDAEALHIVGMIRTRRIARSEILAIEKDDLSLPLVQWVPPGSRDRWSVLSPLMLGSSAFLPASFYRRRYRFLASLRRWAPDQPIDAIRAGFITRTLDLATAAILAVWRSPAKRIVFAAVLIVVSALLYVFGMTDLLAVVEGDAELSRGALSVVVLVPGFAEAAYWIMPIRKRHPVGWRVVLAIVVLPLIAIAIAALLL